MHRWTVLGDRNAVSAAIRQGGLPFGNGRSYGDVCLNPGGTLWSTRGLDRFIAFDAESGVVECEAGVLLGEIIDVLLPRGWFLPVAPGTRFVSVGGAIANDVHGKGHHRTGSFGDQLLSLQLARTDGQVIECSADTNADWLRATVGGLGLTGVITRARLQLRRVPGPWLDADAQPFDSLEEFFTLSNAAAAGFEYAVSWIDCAAGGRGRGVFFRANHSDCSEPLKPRNARTVPLVPPVSLVNRLSLRAFNAAYFGLHQFRQGRRKQDYRAFFFPLDNLLEWNRIYGPRGFFQYQSVVPPGTQLDATRAMLDEIARSRMGSFLAVLKTFGDRPAPGLLSFPMAGTTLALDFPNHGDATLALFQRLDAIVLAAGGRLYPAKDARMPRAMFEAGYPRLPEFLRFRDPGISSSLSRRLLGS
jgi:FAD/FMN-containing dehydrogenase